MLNFYISEKWTFGDNFFFKVYLSVLVLYLFGEVFCLLCLSFSSQFLWIISNYAKAQAVKYTFLQEIFSNPGLAL